MEATLAAERTIFDFLDRGGFPVEVDYSKTLEEMVATGKYDEVDPSITSKRFPIVGAQKEAVDILLVNYKVWPTTSSVQADLDSCGLRPANIAELLAFGARYPERQNATVALGSKRKRFMRCGGYPCVYTSGKCRQLIVLYVSDGWHTGCSFAAVKKLPKK